ncbi:MAG: TetR family transcriptional regulator [Propionibacteriaceae bacterium]|nr:TetR family transcriptional regulator [Propionibacteriaceae bacterium]
MTGWGRKSGPKPSFTHADAVEVALAVGIRDFTLAEVARRLGVGTPALYRIVTSREDLLRSCLIHVAQHADFSIVGSNWQDLLRYQAERLWELLETYRGLAETLLTVTWAYQFFLPGLKAWENALIARGLPPEEAAFMLDFVGDTVICTHVAIEAHRAQTAGPDGEVATGLEISQTRLVEEGLTDEAPELLRPRPAWADRGLLDRKIDFIIEGLASKLG